MKKQYYLFGKSATDIYHETNDISKVVDDGCEYAIYRHDPNLEFSVDTLLDAYSGWDGYAQISENEFETLVKHEQS